MKTHRGFLSALVLVAMASLSCAQSLDKMAATPGGSAPELRWKYESGG